MRTDGDNSPSLHSMVQSHRDSLQKCEALLRNEDEARLVSLVDFSEFIPAVIETLQEVKQDTNQRIIDNAISGYVFPDYYSFAA